MSHILFGTESEKSITKKCHRSSILQQPSSPANKMVISLKNQNFFWKIFLKHYATWTFRSYLAGLSVMEGKLCFSSPPCTCEWTAKASFVAARGFGTEVVILNDLCRDRLGLQCCASVVPLCRVLSHTPLPSVQIWAVLRTDHIRAKNDSFYDFGKCLSNQKDWSRQNLCLSWNKWKKVSSFHWSPTSLPSSANSCSSMPCSSRSCYASASCI